MAIAGNYILHRLITDNYRVLKLFTGKCEHLKRAKVCKRINPDYIKKSIVSI